MAVWNLSIINGDLTKYPEVSYQQSVSLTEAVNALKKERLLLALALALSLFE